MKKKLCLIFSVIFILMCVVPAFAAGAAGTEDQPDPDELAQEEIISLTKKALGTENATKLAKMLRKDGGYDVLRKHSKDFRDLYNDTVESLADTSNTITAYRIVSEAISDAQKLFEPEIRIKVTFGDSNIGYDAATGTFNFTFAYVVEYGGDSVKGTTNTISVVSSGYGNAEQTPDSENGENPGERITPSPEPTEKPEETVPEEDVSSPEDTEALEEESTPAPTETPGPDAEPSETPEPDAEASETPDPQASEESSDPADAETIAEVTPAPSTAPSPVTTHGMHVIVRHWHVVGMEGQGQKYEQVEQTLESEGKSITVQPNAKDGEEFTSFSVSAGHDAVSFDGSGQTATITYKSNIPLVKVHVFYDKTPEQTGREFTGADFSDNEVDYEVDTLPSTSPVGGEDSAKIYNTAEGLHTDKYASEIEGSDGRTFNVTLESWFAGENLADVGLVLDASGSMAFLSPDNKEKVTVSTAKQDELGIKPNTALTADQVNAILDSHKTDNSKLGYSGYTYYVWDRRVATNELVPLGYWDGGSISEEFSAKTSTNEARKYFAAKDNNDEVLASIATNSLEKASRAGWYYVNTVSYPNQIFNENTGTGKEFFPINEHDFPADGDSVFTNNYNSDKSLIYLNGGSCALGDQNNWKDEKNKGPSIFFVDEKGYLCCICDNGRLFESYVYEKDDTTRIKAETLQHALGTFVNGLHGASPGSFVSAVRFSAKGGELKAWDEENWQDKLILQKWTSDPSKSTNMMSLLHGGADGGANGYTGDNEYNYVLTGGTYTWTGLQAFKEKLAEDSKLTAEGRNAKKYLIVFTDGKDQGKNKEAEREADELKDKGYTIYCVALTGGAFEIDEEALTFLKSIASEDEMGINPGDPKSHMQFGSSDAAGGDGLDSAFEEILSQITYDLREYNVQDYIDPRFDLVDYTDGETVVHLNNDGNIVIGDIEKKLESVPADPNAATDTTKGYGIVLSPDSNLKTDAARATLYWDGNAGLYYLRWSNVDIPGCSVASNDLDIWRTVVTIRAKDDFIGGNAVLTNGTKGNQNMVYMVGDENAGSGTGDMWQKPENEVENQKHPDADEHPSKGFPRPTVNVGLLPRNVEMSQTIYLGETIDPVDIARQLELSLSEDDGSDSDKNGSRYYWEFLERYANYDANYKELPDPLSALLTDIIKAGETGKEIGYSYLPADTDTLTGGVKYLRDILGTLTYSWGVIGADTGKAEPFVTMTVDGVQYGLYVNFSPYANGTHNNDGMIEDNNYREPQAGVGDEFTDPGQGQGTHTTNIVHGEIALQVKVPADALKTVFDEIQKTDGDFNSLTITVNLERSYNGGLGAPAPNIEPLRITLTRQDIETAMPDAQGYINIFTDPTNAQKLPIGKYTATLSVDNEKAKNYLHFVLGYADPGEYADERFSDTVVADGKRVADVKADQLKDGVGFVLGSETEPAGEIGPAPEEYLNKRVGILLVTGDMGQMTVSKTVKGVDDREKDWHFRIELSDKTLSGTYGDMTFKDGVAEFTLKHGESKTAVGIPVGVTYTVTEAEANQENWETSWEGDVSGTIVSGTDPDIVCINRELVTLPYTGGSGTGALFAVSFCLIATGVAILFFFRRNS